VSVKSLNNETEVKVENWSPLEQSDEDNNLDAREGLRKLRKVQLCNWYFLTIITRPITSGKVTQIVASYSRDEQREHLQYSGDRTRRTGKI
jgi:hypothetical protein